MGALVRHIRLEDETVREIKSIAALEGLTIGQAITQMLKKLKEYEKKDK